MNVYSAFRIFFQHIGTGLRVFWLSAQAEEPWPRCVLSRPASPWRQGTGGGWLCSLPELDPRCAAGRGVHGVDVAWGGRQKVVAPAEAEVSTPCLFSGASRSSRPRSSACNSQLGGPSSDLGVAPQCKIWEAGVQVNSAHLTKRDTFRPSTEQILNSLPFGTWMKDSLWWNKFFCSISVLCNKSNKNCRVWTPSVPLHSTALALHSTKYHGYLPQSWFWLRPLK